MYGRFGNNDMLDLQEIGKVANTALQRGGRELDGHVGDDIALSRITPFELMDTKGYTARGEASIEYKGQPLGSGKVHVILFRPGEGTGNREEGYNIPEIDAAWTPRTKRDHAELFMAVGTAYEGQWFEEVNHLSLTDYNAQQPLIKPLTMKLQDHVNILRRISNPFTSPLRSFDLTLDRGCDSPYGDPHAVIFDPRGYDSLKTDEASHKLFQVGAFLSFPEPSEGLEMVRGVVASQPKL